jgi:hypothetical protein
MATTTTETFFRPAETARERLTLPAPLHNRCRLLLSRCPTQSVFIPIRSMQYLAVIDPVEIIFVDNQGYAVSNGQGGRIIVMSWDMRLDTGRDSLVEPVPIEIVHYRPEGRDTHRRVMSEFPPALQRYEERQKSGVPLCLTATILPFTART